MNTSHADSAHRSPTLASVSAASTRPGDEFVRIRQWAGVRNVPASLRAYMFQIACAPPCTSTVPRLDVLAAHAMTGPVSSPQTLSDSYDRILRHAPDFRIALLEGLYQSLVGCSGWTYVGRDSSARTRKTILIAAEAVMSGESAESVLAALSIRSRYPHAVLQLVEALGAVAYRLPTAEPSERTGADLAREHTLSDATTFYSLCRACRLGPRYVMGYVALNGFEEHNALISLQESAATAVALACASAGIGFDQTCERMRLPRGLQGRLEGRYLAARVAKPSEPDGE
jgi:hypothetical protein